MSSIDDVVTSLESVSERLAEMAIDALRGALDEGRTSRPEEEKALTQARRAVEKALHLLRPLQD